MVNTRKKASKETKQKASSEDESAKIEEPAKKNQSKERQKKSQKSKSSERIQEDKKNPKTEKTKPQKTEKAKPSKTEKAKPPKAATPKQEEEEVKIVKAYRKGQVAVDPEFPSAANHHVYEQGGKAWACTLNQADVKRNNNKFYIIQILRPDSGANSFIVWTRWGRVGYAGQSNRFGPVADINIAIAEYSSKYRSKTRGGYTEIEIVCHEEEEKEKPKPSKKTKKTTVEPSKLPGSVQDLVKLIFDVNNIKKTLAEIGYDAKKMPLGKLSQNNIRQGMQILKDIESVLDGKMRGSVEDLSSAFFSLIPHDFGYRNLSMFTIKNKDTLKEKITMLENLAEMKIATNILEEDSEEKNYVDEHYQKLGCGLEPLDKNSDLYELLCDYVGNTHATTHNQYSLTVLDIFRVHRSQEEGRYTKHIQNDMLLWHGSRLSNWAGILSQGLRIAPPEAPVTGYMFGKGIYFADMVSKSANYCFTSRHSNVGLLLLCQVAIGDYNEKLNADCYAASLPPGKHSTKGCGKTAPPESSYIIIEDSKVPIGKAQPTNANGSLLYNEYIVYDVAQVKMKYLFKIRFNYR